MADIRGASKTDMAPGREHDFGRWTCKRLAARQCKTRIALWRESQTAAMSNGNHLESPATATASESSRNRASRWQQCSRNQGTTSCQQSKSVHLDFATTTTMTILQHPETQTAVMMTAIVMQSPVLCIVEQPILTYEQYE